MPPQNYRHQIIRLNGADPQAAKYQLQMFELGQQRQPRYRAQWSFQTYKGLLAFLKTYFPSSSLLQQETKQPIQFLLAHTFKNKTIWLSPFIPAAETSVFGRDRSSQSDRDLSLVSMPLALANASCD